MLKTKLVQKGKWTTLEKFVNAKGSAFFRLPAGATIKVRYAAWIFGKDRQKQTLDGENYKKLVVGGWSLFVARMQISVPEDATVNYDVYPGGVAIKSPKISF